MHQSTVKTSCTMRVLKLEDQELAILSRVAFSKPVALAFDVDQKPCG